MALSRLQKFQVVLRYVRENINQVSWEVVRDSKELQNLAITLNKMQLMKGQNSKEENFGPYTSTQHARRRAAVGLQTDHIDLHFKGGFYDGFEVREGETADEIFRITSTNDKTEIFVDRIRNRRGFGEDIFGLTPDSLEIFKEAFNKKLEERMELYLNA